MLRLCHFPPLAPTDPLRSSPLFRGFVAKDGLAAVTWSRSRSTNENGSPRTTSGGVAGVPCPNESSGYVTPISETASPRSETPVTAPTNATNLATTTTAATAR